MIWPLIKYIGKAGRRVNPSFHGFGVKNSLAEDVGEEKAIIKLHQINRDLYSFSLHALRRKGKYI